MLLKGMGVSTGVVQGSAFVLGCGRTSAVPQRSVAASEIPAERARFDAAVARAAEELVALEEEVHKSLGASQAQIFGVHRLIVHDQGLRSRVLRALEEKRINAELAVSEVFNDYIENLERASRGNLGSRVADLDDVRRRLLSALADQEDGDCLDIPEGAIVVSDELLPSVTARLELDQVQGFVTERGNRFSHSSILARSLGTPAVASVPGAATKIRTGDRLIVDGIAGLVFINPDGAVQREYDRLAGDLRSAKERLRELVDLPTVTLDGTTLPLMANVNKFSDTEAALLYNADGIGLYRTEFAFAIRTGWPTEDDQFEFLQKAADRMQPRKIYFRLLDVGGDKTLPYLRLPPTRNPFLAERGVRLLLRRLDILKTQMRAFLRVSARHPVSILLPVVVGVEDVQRVREVLRQVQSELSAEGKPFNPKIRVGAMIEVPSAAVLAHALAKEADFLSLGTNDLVQYVLGADREDAASAPDYQPLHPAVLRLIDSVVRAAKAFERELSICGEMAGEPLHTALLLGLGLRVLSVAPGQLLQVKDAIRKTRLDDARRLALNAVELDSSSAVENLLQPEGVSG